MEDSGGGFAYQVVDPQEAGVAVAQGGYVVGVPVMARPAEE